MAGMEAGNNLFAGEIAKFHQLKSSIDKLVYSNSDSYRTELQRIIDQLNNVEHNPKMINEEVNKILLSSFDTCSYSHK